MEKAKILFVSQEITPYLRDSQIGNVCRYLPQGTQEKGKEIRTFMPRFGCINERRHQLHEVIRLSGMNIIINDSDHPLIIKVASIQQARMQVYFIDSEDYFHRKFILHDKDNRFFNDNDARAVFFNRGVLETVKKLGWAPDVIHCHGWMSALIAPYVKKVYKKHPIFSESKVIISIYDDSFSEYFSELVVPNIVMDDLSASDLSQLKKDRNYVGWMKTAIDYADGIIIGSENIDKAVYEYAKKSKLPMLEYQGEDNYVDAFNKFYDKVLINEEITC
jgi:starch synthase